MENENRIIADFYGKSQQFNNLMGGKTTLYSTPTHPNSCHAELHELEYHTSWDWLMPAWFKFRDLKLESVNLVIFNIHRSTIVNAICYGSLESACKFLSEAISWYNTLEGRQEK